MAGHRPNLRLDTEDSLPWDMAVPLVLVAMGVGSSHPMLNGSNSLLLDQTSTTDSAVGIRDRQRNSRPRAMAKILLWAIRH